MRSLIVLLFFLAGSVTAAFADSESDGAAAEKAGKYREALGHYTSALQAAPEGSEKDQQLREKIIEVAAKLKPAPVVPEEVTRFMARGRAAVGAAKDPQGFERAANEFRQALKLAPWLADAYYNLGVVLDKAEKYPEAIQNLKLYLHARRDAPDAKQVQELIYEVEYRQEEAKRTKEQALSTQKAKGPDFSSLAGSWWAVYPKYGKRVPTRSGEWTEERIIPKTQTQVRIVGDSFHATVFVVGWEPMVFDGQFVNGILSGTAIWTSSADEAAYSGCPQFQKFPFTAEINFNEPSIVLIVKGSYWSSGRNQCHFDPQSYNLSLLLTR